MLAALAAGDGAQQPNIRSRKSIGLTQLPERNVLRRPFADAADRTQPFDRLVEVAISVEHMRIGHHRSGDRR